MRTNTYDHVLSAQIKTGEYSSSVKSADLFVCPKIRDAGTRNELRLGATQFPGKSGQSH